MVTMWSNGVVFFWYKFLVTVNSFCLGSFLSKHSCQIQFSIVCRVTSILFRLNKALVFDVLEIPVGLGPRLTDVVDEDTVVAVLEPMSLSLIQKSARWPNESISW